MSFVLQNLQCIEISTNMVLVLIESELSGSYSNTSLTALLELLTALLVTIAKDIMVESLFKNYSRESET